VALPKLKLTWYACWLQRVQGGAAAALGLEQAQQHVAEGGVGRADERLAAEQAVSSRSASITATLDLLVAHDAMARRRVAHGGSAHLGRSGGADAQPGGRPGRLAPGARPELAQDGGDVVLHGL
jgi:hypothetical protein